VFGQGKTRTSPERGCPDDPTIRVSAHDASALPPTGRRHAGFVEPCLPTLAHTVPTGPLWVHEIKHDGYRFICRRFFTRRGYGWTDRVPRSAHAMLALRVASAMTDIRTEQLASFYTASKWDEKHDGPGHRWPRSRPARAPYPDSLLKRDLAVVKAAWRKYQSVEDKEGVYTYLTSVSAAERGRVARAVDPDRRHDARKPTQLPLSTRRAMRSITATALAMLQICRTNELSYCAPVLPCNRRMVDTNEQEKMMLGAFRIPFA